ncbi:MAG: hypothetical protein Kow0025_07010 [Thermodesulfovibrionales bacterium]
MFQSLKGALSLKAKLIIAVLSLVIIVGGGVIAFKFYDFTQNNPKFCVSCHLMQPAYDQWAKSVHNQVNCHDCHHLSIVEQNKLLVTFVLQRPEKVPPRHGEVIVPWKYCVRCHWEKDEKFAGAPPINQSRMHAKHYFMEQIECSKCHGYIVHEFEPEERFCVRCHQGKEVHGTGMEGLACLNCHTDRTADLRPGRDKCLFCHGGKAVRDKLMAEGTLDVTHYKPSEKTIESATKIKVPEGAPMQFNCYECHKPHTKVRPDWGDCLNCHRNITEVGKHDIHIKVVGMECKQCHKPHSWTVTDESARKDCVLCHEYRKPERFL